MAAPINAAIVGIVWLIVADVIDAPWPVAVAILSVLLAALVANLALGARRMHDLGRPGAWVLVYYAVPPFTTWGFVSAGELAPSAVLGLISLGLPVAGVLDLGLRPGAVGTNRYGADPANRTDLAAFE